MPSNKKLNIILKEFQVSIMKSWSQWAECLSPEGFSDTEFAVSRLCRQLGDEIMIMLLLNILENPVFTTKVQSATKTMQTKWRNGGARSTKIKFLGGTVLKLHNVQYLKPYSKKKGAGRKRKPGRRGKGGKAFFPALAALGIFRSYTPALQEEIIRQVSDSDSVRCARQALARRDIDFGHKETLKIFNKFSSCAVKQRDDELSEAIKSHKSISEILKGKRIVVSTDGGRIRIRKKKVGRRRKNGHHSFEAAWKEPKLITIYVIGEDGKVENSFQPFYDGTMGDADSVFNMIAGYLISLGGANARELIFLGDGAKWIWNRIEKLAETVGIPIELVTQVVDWYHAVENLWEIVKVPSKWSQKQREKWIKHAKSLLYTGDIASLIDKIKSISRGRKAKDISKHIDYFRNNESRMQYAFCEQRKIPIGSGSIESAVRRIVNMRLKSNAKYWLEENAEGMILIRSYLKSGRFESMCRASQNQASAWWIRHCSYNQNISIIGSLS